MGQRCKCGRSIIHSEDGLCRECRESGLQKPEFSKKNIEKIEVPVKVVVPRTGQVLSAVEMRWPRGACQKCGGVLYKHSKSYCKKHNSERIMVYREARQKKEKAGQ